MDVVSLDLLGLKLITPKIHRDARGFFLEAYRAGAYREHGILDAFIQDNHSRSETGCLRGLHAQRSPGQAKLVRVVAGEIWDVAVDIRSDSPTFGRHQAVKLDAKAHAQLYIPAGFLHGFVVTQGPAEVLYKVSSLYDAQEEKAVAFNDPFLGIQWPEANPKVSQRDAQAPSFWQAMADFGIQQGASQ